MQKAGGGGSKGCRWVISVPSLQFFCELNIVLKIILVLKTSNFWHRYFCIFYICQKRISARNNKIRFYDDRWCFIFVRSKIQIYWNFKTWDGWFPSCSVPLCDPHKIFAFHFVEKTPKSVMDSRVKVIWYFRTNSMNHHQFIELGKKEKTIKLMILCSSP